MVSNSSPHFFTSDVSDQYEMFEGDILLTKEQMEAVKKGLGPNGGLSSRGLSNSNYRLWPRGIVYYTIDTSKWNFITLHNHFLLSFPYSDRYWYFLKTESREFFSLNILSLFITCTFILEGASQRMMTVTSGNYSTYINSTSANWQNNTIKIENPLNVFHFSQANKESNYSQRNKRMGRIYLHSF